MINSASQMQQTEETVKHLLKRKNVRELLNQHDSEIVIRYIGELYKGNGWIVSYHAPSGHPSAILLSYPKSPQQVVLIVRTDCSTHELSFDDCRDHLLYFENELAPLYKCSQFCLIAINSFEARAEKLESFNLLLQDWSYVEELIENYSLENMREPRIQLFAHNKAAYKKVQKAFADHKTVAVVQATGTGKSYLIAKVLHDFSGENRLVLAPSHYILDQLKEHIRWEQENILFMTYQRAMNMTEQEIKKLGVKFIVLDEFHRCGADEWGRGVQNILNAYPDSYVFGTTATPVRYLDNNRDMAQEFFNGTIAENINLAQAIVRNILPMPKYITALYTLKEEAAEMRARINRSIKSAQDKERIKLELDTFEIEWENSYGIPTLFKKHLRAGMNKFIVFCKDESHLNEMEALVKGWFHDAFAGKIVKTFRVLSNEKEKNKNFNDFKTFNADDEIHLLFSINMLNEGLHVNEVNGVILLRPTVSPIIFYQQIGRCLKVGMDKTPVIFDLVNNFNSIHSKDFLYDLEFARTSYFNERKETELSIRCPEFTVQDETREITELFGSIAFQLTAWEEIYDRMKTFFKLNGHCRPAPSNCSDEQLMYWVTRQRKKYNNGLLSADRIQKLNAINFDWNYHQNNWDIMFNELASYRSAHGHCRIPSHTKNVSKLASWVLTQRKDYREGKISPERIKRLEQLNFSWNPMEEDFNKMFRLFESYIEEYGNCRVNYKTHKKLFSWLSSRRADFRLNRLSKEKVERLNALDSKWSIDYSEELWNNNFMELMEYHEEFGHCDASATQRKYASLGAWVSDQRTKYRKGELSHEQIKKLEALNFRWNPVQERWDEMYGKLKQYHFEHGNCLVKSSFDNELASFVLKNRKALKNGELSEERKKLLKEIDFELDGLMAKWELRYAQLLEYKEKYGDCNVSQGYKENSKLATWVTLQIKKFNKKILGEYHLRKLTEAGFDFECKLLSKRIDTYLYQLSQYKKQHGNINIPATWNETIYGWLSKERRKYKDGKSAPAISSALEQLGVIWETKDYHWGNMFRLLMDFKKENGHTDVTSLNNDNKQFVEWVRNMRSARKRGILPLHKLNALGQTGFLWETLHWDKEWNRRLEVLRAYYERHGDLNTRYTKGKIDKKASCLIFSLRKSFKEGKLSSSQIEQLRAMDFTFDLEEKARGHWFEMFELLKQFKSKYGHCAVPEAWKKNRALAQWARLQRKRKEDKKLHNEFIDLLNKEGFLWDPMEGRYDRKTRG